MNLLPTANTERLIRFLADGRFHSDEEVGRRLGVTRASALEQLKQLTHFGLQLQFVEGRGYRLLQRLELLDRSLIHSLLQKQLSNSSATSAIQLDVLFATESTNDFAMAKLSRGQAAKGYLCLAEFQYRGRGRRGRNWVSPLGSNLTMSLIWEFARGATALDGLSLAVGIAVAKTLKALGLQQVTLKWPNDILIDGCKLGGILLEMRDNPLGYCQVVIGMGLNVFMTVDAATEGIEQPWTAIAEYLPEVSRNYLAVALIRELANLLEQYSETGFSAFKQEWLSYAALNGHKVVVNAGATSHKGVVAGVADDGGLLLNIDGVEHFFHSGDISLRPCHDS